MPLVSVIIPAYNAAPTIARTLRSVCRQTLGDLEIVVIDDGSTDGTAARVRGIGDRRIRLLSYANGGLPTARNRGIAEARGEYLAFLDADDLWARRKLESHVAAFAADERAGAVYSWSCTIDEEDRVLGRHVTVCRAGDVYAELLRVFFVGNASNAVVRRGVVDSVGTFDPTLTCGEDWEFLVRVASRWPFAVIPEYQVFYRQRAGSMSSDVDRMHRGLLVACDRMFAQAPPELRGLKPWALANVHLYLARSYLTRGTERVAVARAAASLASAVRLRPTTLLDATTVRLCARWLVACTSSLRTARRASEAFHRYWRVSVPEVDPWR